MAILFSSERVKQGRTRKFPFLPRIGFVIDFGGRSFTYKQTPILETVANLIERGVNLSNLLKITQEQLAEIQFPREKKFGVIKTSAKTISVRRR
jgi:hypothetical protein